MKRDVEKQLIEWKAKDARTPLIIRGARQVGKSYTVENFGKTHFQQLLIVNFEEREKPPAALRYWTFRQSLSDLS